MATNISESVGCTHQCIAQLIAMNGTLLRSIQAATNTTLTIEKGPRVRIVGTTVAGVVTARDTLMALRCPMDHSVGSNGVEAGRDSNGGEEDVEGPEARRLRHAADLCGAERSKCLGAADVAFATGNTSEGQRLMTEARRLCLETQGLHADAARLILERNNKRIIASGEPAAVTAKSSVAVLDVRGLLGHEAIDAIRCKLNVLAAQRRNRHRSSATSVMEVQTDGERAVGRLSDGNNGSSSPPAQADSVATATSTNAASALDVVAIDPSVLDALACYFKEEGLVYTRYPPPMQSMLFANNNNDRTVVSTFRVFVDKRGDDEPQGRYSGGGASSSDASPCDGAGREAFPADGAVPSSQRASTQRVRDGSGPEASCCPGASEQAHGNVTPRGGGCERAASNGGSEGGAVQHPAVGALPSQPCGAPPKSAAQSSSCCSCM